MWVLIIALTAGAVTPEILESRLAEVASLRLERVPGAPEISQKEYLLAIAGKVPTGMKTVEGFSFKKGYGVRILELPIAKVWAAVNDDTGKLKHTKLSYAELIQGQYCEGGRQVFQYLPLPMVSDRWWVSNFYFNDAIMEKSAGRVREMRWESTDPKVLTTDSAKSWAAKGIPVSFNKGAWFLIDLDGKSTLIEYYAWSDPSGYIPASLTNTLAAGGIKNTIDAVRKIAEEGSSCPVQ